MPDRNPSTTCRASRARPPKRASSVGSKRDIGELYGGPHRPVPAYDLRCVVLFEEAAVIANECVLGRIVDSQTGHAALFVEDNLVPAPIFGNFLQDYPQPDLTGTGCPRSPGIVVDPEHGS